MRCFLWGGLLLSASMIPVVLAQAEPPQGQRVFSCGNSFHVYVPDMLKEMTLAAGISGHEIVGTSMIGGAKVLKHWNVKDEDNKAKSSLKTGMVDVLTLTGVYLPDEGIENFARLGLEKNPGIRITMQEFWLPFDEYNRDYYAPPWTDWPKIVDHNAATGEKLRQIHERYFREMDETVSGLNKSIGHHAVFVVPVGQAVIALREKIITGKAPGLKVQEDLFKDPLGHPKPALQALVTYCHFAVIYGRSPVGLPLPAALAKTRMTPEDKEALNLLLQQLAWEAVTNHPLSGVPAKQGT